MIPVLAMDQARLWIKCEIKKSRYETVPKMQSQVDLDIQEVQSKVISDLPIEMKRIIT